MSDKTHDQQVADDLACFGTSFVRQHADGRRERLDPREVYIFTADRARLFAKVWVWAFFLTIGEFAIFATVLHFIYK